MAEADADRTSALPEPLVIRGCEPADREALLALHRASFLASGAARYASAAERFERLLDPVHTLVATRGGRVLGFVAFQTLDEDLQSWLWLSLAWLWSRYPERAQRVSALFRRTVDPARRGDVVVRHLAASDARERIGARPGRRDAFVTDIAVCEPERRDGVASALLAELLHRSRVGEVPRMWSTVWRAGAGSAFFERSGFAPLIELGPWYGDGSTTALMVRDCGRPEPAPASDPGYPGRRWRRGSGPLLSQLLWAWILARGLADRVSLGDPLAVTTFTVLLGVVLVRAFDTGQRADRALGLVYRVGGGGLEVWRGARLVSSLALDSPVVCAFAAPLVTFPASRAAVALSVTSRRGSRLVGPLALVDGYLLIEEVLVTAERAEIRDHSFVDGDLAAALVLVLGVAAAVASVVVLDPVVHAAAALASLLVAAHGARRSLRWNDGSPRALWPLIVVPLIAAALWLGFAPRLAS